MLQGNHARKLQRVQGVLSVSIIGSDARGIGPMHISSAGLRTVPLGFFFVWATLQNTWSAVKIKPPWSLELVQFFKSHNLPSRTEWQANFMMLKLMFQCLLFHLYPLSAFYAQHHAGSATVFGLGTLLCEPRKG